MCDSNLLPLFMLALRQFIHLNILSILSFLLYIFIFHFCWVCTFNVTVVYMSLFIFFSFILLFLFFTHIESQIIFIAARLALLIRNRMNNNKNNTTFFYYIFIHIELYSVVAFFLFNNFTVRMISGELDWRELSVLLMLLFIIIIGCY